MRSKFVSILHLPWYAWYALISLHALLFAEYLSTLLKLAQLVNNYLKFYENFSQFKFLWNVFTQSIGCVCWFLINSYFYQSGRTFALPNVLFLLMVVTFLIGTFSLLVFSLFSSIKKGADDAETAYVNKAKMSPRSIWNENSRFFFISGAYLPYDRSYFSFNFVHLHDGPNARLWFYKWWLLSRAYGCWGNLINDTKNFIFDTSHL